MLLGAGPGRERERLAILAGQTEHGVGDRAGGSLHHVPVDSVDDHVGRAPRCRRDHRYAAGEGLQDHQTVGLVRRRQHEDVCGAQPRTWVGLPAGQVDPVADARAVRAARGPGQQVVGATDHDQPVVRRQAGERIERDVEALAVELVTDEEQDMSLGCQAEGGARLAALGVVRAGEGLQVDAVADHGRRRGEPGEGLLEEPVLEGGQVDHEPVRATWAVAPTVPDRGEEVQRVPHHPEHEAAA